MIGPSALSWDGGALAVRIAEVTAPVPSRIRGTIRLHPAALTRHTVALDGDGRHRWCPIAPVARVEVALERPQLRWAGAGYLDANAGDEPLADAFRGWDWSRASLRGGGAAVLYEVTGRGGERRPLALHFDASGRVQEFEPPAPMQLPPTRWRVARRTRADAGYPVRVLRTLEDTPFYARSVLRTRLLREPVTAVHESLSLERFQKLWVQMLLPFRLPRALR